MNDVRHQRRSELAGQIEQLLKDGKIRTVDEICAEMKKKRGVQSVLETDKRFRLVAPGRASIEHRYTLMDQTQWPVAVQTQRPTVVQLPGSAVVQSLRPAVEKHGNGGERPNYVEVWVDSPFELLNKGEALAVDAANLLGRRCGGMIHKEGQCPQPAPLWPLLVLLAKVRTVHSHIAFFADASTRHHVQGQESFEKLVEAGAVMEVPASYTADSKLLAWADKNNGVVLTDDVKMRGQYMELYPWTNDPTRFIGHMVDDETRKEMSYVRKRLPHAPAPSTGRVVSTPPPLRRRG